MHTSLKEQLSVAHTVFVPDGLLCTDHLVSVNTRAFVICILTCTRFIFILEEQHSVAHAVIVYLKMIT